MVRAIERLLAGSSLDRQIKLEREAIARGVDRYRAMVADAERRGTAASLKAVERMLVHWFAPMEHMVNEFQKQERFAKDYRTGQIKRTAWWMVNQLSPDKLAVITMTEAINECMMHPEGKKLTPLCYSIGRAVFAEINMGLMRKDTPEALSELDKKYKNLTPARIQWKAKQSISDALAERKMAVIIGSELFRLLMNCASASDYEEELFQPAFVIVKKPKGKKVVNTVYLSDLVIDRINEAHEIRKLLCPRHLPMIVRPLLWKDRRRGGYTLNSSRLIARPDPLQQELMNQADLSKIHEGLNAVNQVGWRVNTSVLSIMEQLWSGGGGVAGLPGHDDLPKPPRPPNIDKDEQVLKAWKKEAAKIHTENKRTAGWRNELLNTLEIANQFKTCERFYFPHFIDFRGRCYTTPLWLNHQQVDYARGLLEFADARDPGDEGRRWIKIHAANCAGMDKLSFDERVKWTDEIIRNNTVERIVADPIDMVDQWAHMDKPFQFLAACMALVDGKAAAHLPVQVDGSCNGLQHYAALGRDSNAARQVNMVPAIEPADIYSTIRDTVYREVQNDAVDGIEIAALVLPHITRKVVKQPVMTKTYDVTRVGARRQVRARLAETDIPSDQVYEASYYLANHIMDAVSEANSGAESVMAWLKDCARMICAHGEVVRWETPLGLPVVQPDRHAEGAGVVTELCYMVLRVPVISDPPKPRKQINGVAPNFIHSMDATHMFMTAVTCANRGLSFAAVHDAYWSHAASMNELSQIIREQFVRLYEVDHLDRLHRHWQRVYPDIELPPPPPQGDFQIQSVIDAPYFFS